MRIFKIIIRVIVFIFLLVLAINNMQIVEFNFLGVYTLKLPLIITLAIFAISGIFIGSLIGLISNLSLKKQISNLKKQLKKQNILPQNEDEII